MRIHFLGVRGSTGAPGPEFIRYGGHTSCVAIERPEDRWLVFDAGTGFRSMATLLRDSPLRGSIVLSHLHWDHTDGLPFLPNADRDDAMVTLYVPDQGDGLSASETLAGRMAPPYFPIDPGCLIGDWVFKDVSVGAHEIEGLAVTAAAVHHKGGAAFGYRIDDGRVSVAYIPDHSFHSASAALKRNAMDLCSNADVLIHDGQYIETERPLATVYGHSTLDEAIDLATRSAVRRLVMTHHAPLRTDVELDAMLAACQEGDLPVIFAREGLVLDVCGT